MPSFSKGNLHSPITNKLGMLGFIEVCFVIYNRSRHLALTIKSVRPRSVMLETGQPIAANKGFAAPAGLRNNRPQCIIIFALDV